MLVMCLSATDGYTQEALPTGDIVQPAFEEAGIDPAEVEASGAVIGKITITNQNIFDLSNPLENKWLYRLANRLHIVTRRDTIKTQLLFVEGDAYSVRLGEESERILRLNSYLRDATIKPVRIEDGVVDVDVASIDVWTLTPDLSVGRSGGENRFGVGIEEQNLLGRGIKLGAKYKTTVDRDTLSLTYLDRNFLQDRYVIGANIANSSDGFFRQFQFGKPFYALNSQSAGGLFYSRGELINQLYDRGDIVAEFNHEFDYDEVSFGTSRGLSNDWVRRYTVGVAYENDTFTESPDTLLPITVIPDDREYLYPFLGFQLLEDRFEKAVNFDQINRTEDRFVGTSLHVRIGYSNSSAGSSGSAWHYRAGFSNSFIATGLTSLTLNSSLTGRWENASAQNALLSAKLRFHRRLGKHQLFYAAVSATAGNNLDIDNPLYLGGETGMRGYPLRYQNGESKALLTLEQRFFTDWYPFRLVHVGAAIFFDAGRVWGESPVDASNLGLLRDIGFGLRLGNTRSGNGRVVHIDIAFPLDGEDDIDSVQILVDVKGSF